MRKFLTFRMVVALSLGAVPAHAGAYSPAEGFVDPKTYVGINYVESFSNTGEASSFINHIVEPDNKAENPNGFQQYLCMKGFGAAPCNFGENPNSHSHAQLIAPVCADKSEINCIESVAIYKAGEAPESAEYVRNIAGDLVGADPTQNLPRGSTTSLWKSQVLHGGGTGLYSVYVALGIAFDTRYKKFHIGQLTALVQPTTEKSGNYQPTTYRQIKNAEGLSRVVGSGGAKECAWLDQGTCGVLEDYSPDTRVKLTIRLESTVGGWFKGRMISPNITVKKFSNKANLVTVDAAPATVPMVTAIAPKNSEDPGILKLLQTDSALRTLGGLHNTRSDYSQSIQTLDYFRSTMKDTASGVNTIWSVGTAPHGTGGQNCLGDTSRVLGIVTTNSTVYEGSAPSFIGGFLQYKVGGMHYLPGGVDLSLGSYDLVMRSDVARCLYGLSKAPVSATVSVVNEKGSKSIATTVVKETKDGWLKMAAYGFTFSKKTIKVKITKKKK